MTGNHRVLGRDAILQAPDLKTERVEVPEWGGDVLVRGMSGRQRDAFEASTIVGKGAERDVSLANFRAKLVAASIVDENGELLFSQEDIEALADKSAAALTRVATVAARLNALTPEDIQELAKN